MTCPKLPDKPTIIKNSHTTKGCVHWFDFENSDPKIKSQKARPYIVISRDNPNSDRVIICPISDIRHYYEKDTTILKYPYHAPLYKEQYSFLEKDSAVLLDQVATIAKSELCEEWYIGKVDDYSDIDIALAYNYEMFESILNTYTDFLKQLPISYKEKYSRK